MFDYQMATVDTEKATASVLVTDSGDDIRITIIKYLNLEFGTRRVDSKIVKILGSQGWVTNAQSPPHNVCSHNTKNEAVLWG